MGQDMTDIHTFCLIHHDCNKSDLVPANIEYMELSNFINRWKELFHLSKIFQIVCLYGSIQPSNAVLTCDHLCIASIIRAWVITCITFYRILQYLRARMNKAPNGALFIIKIRLI